MGECRTVPSGWEARRTDVFDSNNTTGDGSTGREAKQSKNSLFGEEDMRACRFVVSHFLTAETKAGKK